MMRIVSLLPSATETLCALGLAEQIVGISHKCDFPHQIANRPRLTKSALRDDLPSEEIHRRVQESAAGRAKLYELDSELLTSLEPDLIVTQDQCSVCAVGRKDVEKVFETTRCRAQIVVLRATRVDDVMGDIGRLGIATERATEAATLITRMRARLSEVQRRTSQAGRPKVFCLSWFNPLMAASHWMTDIVELAGGFDGLGATDGTSRSLEPVRLISYNPDAIFLMPCDFTLERTIREWVHLKAACRDLNAVRKGQVYAVHGSLFHRPGPRLVDGVELLASALHPAQAQYGHSEDSIREVA